MTTLFPRGTAEISGDGVYRFTLTRMLSPPVTACGRYLGDLDATTPVLHCIRFRDHDGACDSARGDRRHIVWVMLNPSVADAEREDQTSRTIQKYGRAWEFHDLTVLNLYAYRATATMDMWRARDRGIDIVGEDNDRYISRVSARADNIMVGWGVGAAGTISRSRFHQARQVAVLKLLGSEVWCIGINSDGSPVHPLYQPEDAIPLRYAA